MNRKSVGEIALIFFVVVLLAPASLGAGAHHPKASFAGPDSIFGDRPDPGLEVRPQNNSTPPTSPGGIVVGTGPDALVLDPSTGDLYVANEWSQNLSIINTSTNMVVGSVSGTPYPEGPALDSAAHLLFVPDFTPCCPSTVSVVDTLTGAVVASIPLGSYNPTSAVFDPDNGYVYVSDTNGQNVSVLNASSEALVTNIPVGRGNPFGLAFDPATGEIYVANSGTGNVTVINPLTDRTVGSFKVPTGNEPTDVAVDPFDRYLYVTDGSCGNCLGNVTVLNATTGALVSNIPVGVDPLSIAFDPTNDNLYVTGESLVLGGNSSSGEGNLTVIDGATDRGVGSLPVGQGPDAVVYDPVDNDLYVANSGSNNVSVVSPTITTYPVTVLVSGLPNGTSWYVSVPGSGTYRSDTSNVTFYERNGTYSVAGGTADLAFAALSFGPVVVAGAPAEYKLRFVPNLDILTFSETGLPAGTQWWVWVTNSVTHATVFGNSTNSTLRFFERNGTFDYVVSSVGNLTPSPQSGEVTMNGAGLTLQIDFSSPSWYDVTFAEVGVPTGWTWGVRLGDVNVTGNQSTLTIPAENGTYPYRIEGLTAPGVGSYPAWSEAQLPLTGNVTVTGAPVVEPTLDFVVYTEIEFSETGLGPGVEWTVYLNASHEHASVSTYATSSGWIWALPGSYEYRVGPLPGYHQSTLPYLGGIDLTLTNGRNGTPLHYEPTLAFTTVTYVATVSETGLPSGERFIATLGGIQKNLIATGDPGVLTWSGLPNGTYGYTVRDISGWHQSLLPYQGNLTVTGGSAPIDGTGVGYAVTLPFAQVTYSAVFEEVGLPVGTSWGVTLGTTLETSVASDSVTVNFVLFDVPNGTFDYRIENVPGWHEGTTSTSGSIAIAGEPFETFTLYFQRVEYPVSFTETGLAAGTNWSLRVGSAVYSSTAATITFSAPNGSSPYVVGSVGGYSASPTSGELVVSGSGVTTPIAFTHHAPPLLPAAFLSAVGGFAVGAAAVGLIAYVWAGRRTPPTSKSPPTSEGSGAA